MIARRLNAALIATLLLACALTPAARGASYEFMWTGAGGYTIEGKFSIPNEKTADGYVNEDVVECFSIKGLKDGEAIGAWSVGMLTERTNWRFNFEPDTLRLRTGGSSVGPFGQEWNMNGAGTSCGAGGFGYNSGGYAQDICIDSRLIVPSQVHRSTPLYVARNDKIKFDASECIILQVS